MVKNVFYVAKTFEYVNDIRCFDAHYIDNTAELHYGPFPMQEKKIQGTTYFEEVTDNTFLDDDFKVHFISRAETLFKHRPYIYFYNEKYDKIKIFAEDFKDYKKVQTFTELKDFDQHNTLQNLFHTLPAYDFSCYIKDRLNSQEADTFSKNDIWD